jgi:hypothetical protein
MILDFIGSVVKNPNKFYHKNFLNYHLKNKKNERK